MRDGLGWRFIGIFKGGGLRFRGKYAKFQNEDDNWDQDELTPLPEAGNGIL